MEVHIIYKKTPGFPRSFRICKTSQEVIFSRNWRRQKYVKDKGNAEQTKHGENNVWTQIIWKKLVAYFVLRISWNVTPFIYFLTLRWAYQLVLITGHLDIVWCRRLALSVFEAKNNITGGLSYAQFDWKWKLCVNGGAAAEVRFSRGWIWCSASLQINSTRGAKLIKYLPSSKVGLYYYE